MPIDDRKHAQLSHITKVRDVLVDVDQDGSDNYKVRLCVRVVYPTAKAGLVWESNPDGNFDVTSNPSTNWAPSRESEGIYTFDATGIGSYPSWDKADGGPFQEGYVLDFEWQYVIDGETYTEIVRGLWGQRRRDTAPNHLNWTFGGLKTAVEDFLGSTPGSLTTSQIVYQAMYMLAQDADWSWLDGDTVSLDVKKNVSEIELPGDFLALRSLERTNDAIHLMEKVDLRTMRHLRERSLSSYPNRTFYMQRMRLDSGDMTAPPRPVLEIWPLPAANAANVYIMDYKRMIPLPTADGDYIQVPIGLSNLVYQATITMAAEVEGDETAQAQRMKYLGMLKNAISMDADRNDSPHIGFIASGGGFSSGFDPFCSIDPEADITAP